MTPFVILALPRSRTYWLSRFLSYGGWHCGHDEARHFRSLDDAKAWLSQPQTGTVETGLAPFWRLLLRFRPGVRVVTVRRSAEDAASSWMRVCPSADPRAILKAFRRLDAKLDQVERRVPGVLSVGFDDLAREDVCAALFKHCLPFAHDRGWWQAHAAANMQIDVPALMRYAAAYRPAIDKLVSHAKHTELAAMARRPAVDVGDVTFQIEPFDVVYRDAQALLASHMVVTEQAADGHTRKNLPLFRWLEPAGGLQVMTARSNGRLAGYLLTVIGPSLDAENIRVAEHTTIFADPAFPGVGMRLQRAADAALAARGIVYAVGRAGTRGSGPRLGAMFRRLGYEEFGHLYRRELKAA